MTLPKGQILRATLPNGYAMTMYQILLEIGSASGANALLSEEEEDDIKEWVGSHSIGVPGGWFPPDDWRLRAIGNINKLKGAFSPVALAGIVEELLTAEVEEDVDARWRVAKPKEKGTSAGV